MSILTTAMLILVRVMGVLLVMQPFRWLGPGRRRTLRHMRSIIPQPVVGTAPLAHFADLQARLVDYASRIGELRAPNYVLDALHAITTKSLPLCVLGAARFPVNAASGSAIRLGKSVFLHKEVPDGWWEEHTALSRGKLSPDLFLARSSLASYTWTEVLRLFEPVGIDRWSHELALKYGMRDGLTCPVGGRWAVAFWSRRALSDILTQPCRIMIFAAANFAALRLEQLAGPDVNRIGSRARLTSRELAVLRLVSTGGQTHDIAQALVLGEETIRSHVKKAEAKLGVRNRTHAACEALRHNLIP
jgi:DNA-binding CsgD family transcriptional regulator